jgi:hypothetical protein
MKKQKRRAIRSAIRGDPAKQVAALPYHVGADGTIRVMLITSRGTRRFVVPKGWPMRKKSGAAAAACEARQEAGVLGRTAKVPIGSFRYWKRLSIGFVPIIVRVFPMAVEEVLEKWKEDDARGRKWLRPDEAASLIDEPALASLVRQIPELIGRN